MVKVKLVQLKFVNDCKILQKHFRSLLNKNVIVNRLFSKPYFKYRKYVNKKYNISM